MGIENFFTEYFLPYLADWKPWVLVLVTIMLNFWVVDLVRPKTAYARKWVIRISSVAICLGFGAIMFEQTRIAVISEIIIGIATPFIYKICHGLMVYFKPGMAKSIADAKIKDDDPKE